MTEFLDYEDVRDNDWRQYQRRNWFVFGKPQSMFDKAHAACMVVVGNRPSPIMFAAAGVASFKGDWIDIAIEAVLKLIVTSLGGQLSEAEIQVWSRLIRIVLQILLSTLVFAQKTAGFAVNVINSRIQEWAVEAQSSL